MNEVIPTPTQQDSPRNAYRYCKNMSTIEQKLRFSQSLGLVWHLSEFIKKSRYRILFSAWDKTWRFSPFPPLPSRFSSKFLMSSALNSDLKSGLLKSDASWLVKLSVSEGSSFTENKDKKMFKNRLSFTSTSFGFLRFKTLNLGRLRCLVGSRSESLWHIS